MCVFLLLVSGQFHSRPIGSNKLGMVVAFTISNLMHLCAISLCVWMAGGTTVLTTQT